MVTEWRQVQSPTDVTLTDVTQSAVGPIAVGGDGRVLRHRPSGWEHLVRYGPSADANPLTAVDTTDGGRRVWFAGANGAVGEYDLRSDTLTNYSAPAGDESSWRAMAVTGVAAESERLYLVDRMGAERSGVRQPDGAMAYDDPHRPGGRTAVRSADFHDGTAGWLVDERSRAFLTTDGVTYEEWPTPTPSVSLYDVASVSESDATAVGTGGRGYAFDGVAWSTVEISPDGGTLYAVDRQDDAGLAAGTGGSVFVRSDGQWRRSPTSVDTPLYGVTGGEPAVAVGHGGTILEQLG